MTTIENARICGISFDRRRYEDHGILTCFVFVEGAGWGCGFGGYGLDFWDKVRERRIGTAYGLEFIASILHVVGVQSWEELPGQYVRVETEGWGGKILRLGHITKDQWFDPKTLRAEQEAA